MTRLTAIIQSMGSVLVCYSGGVDSAFVLSVAHRVLGDKCIGMTAVSPSLADFEREEAITLAKQIGARHELVESNEIEDEDYAKNHVDRCFHCKSELYGELAALAARRGAGALLSGANADDAGDWRPGLRAAADHGVVHPLLEAEVGKPLVRALAAYFGVPSAAKPASPCLASRIPYGVPVDAATLAQIDRAEQAVKALGCRVLRVRHHGALGRLELAAGELEAAMEEPGRRAALEAAVRSAGYAAAVLAERPFRSGSLNDGVRG